MGAAREVSVTADVALGEDVFGKRLDINLHEGRFAGTFALRRPVM
jgi:hypothetical protein